MQYKDGKNYTEFIREIVIDSSEIGVTIIWYQKERS